MAQGKKGPQPTLHWCTRCSVGWAVSEGWRCWLCGLVQYVERQVCVTSQRSLDESADRLIGEYAEVPDTYLPDMFGLGTEALTQPPAVLLAAA